MSSTSRLPLDGRRSITPSLTALSKQKARYWRTSMALASSQQPGGSTLPASISSGRAKKNRSCGRWFTTETTSAVPVVRPARPIRCR
jgi:hypothetical protein